MNQALHRSSAAGQSGIVIERLRKVYGHGDTAVEALKDVNMTVGPGEVVGLVGPSGSGKSTLLKCLGAIIEPTAGRMVLGGKVIYDGGWKIPDLRTLRRDSIGFVFQAPYLIPFLDVTDNVALLPMLAGVDLGPEGYAVVRVNKVLPRPPAIESVAEQDRGQYRQWWTAAETTPPRQLQTNETVIATKEKVEGFLGRLVAELDAAAFLDNPLKRAGTVRNLRHFFERGEVTEQELRTLHGVVSELSKGRRRRRRPDD